MWRIYKELTFRFSLAKGQLAPSINRSSPGGTPIYLHLVRFLQIDHQAALSVGISITTIWVLVWFIAGIIALMTGIAWGSRAGVSFALEIIALKALPVLMLTGALAGMAAALLSQTIFVSPTSGVIPLIKGLTIALLGGK